MGGLKVVFQHDLMDCGAAALLTVAHYFRVRTNYQWIRKHLAIGPDGATLHDLALTADSLGLRCDPVQFESFEECGPRSVFIFCSVPKAIRSGFGHYVVVRFLGNGSCEVVDPAYGKSVVEVRSLSDRFASVALQFEDEANQNGESLPVRRVEVTDELARIFKKFRKNLLFLGFVSLVVAALNVVPSYFFGALVDTIGRKEWGPVVPIVFGYVFCGALRHLLGVAQDYWFFKLGQIFSLNLSGVLIRKVLHLDWASYSSRRYGDYATRFGAVQDFKSLASEIVNNVFGRICTLALSAVALFAIHYQLLILAVLVGLAVLMINLFSSQMQAKVEYQMSVQAAGSGSNIYELLSLKRWIKMNDATSYFFMRWSRLTKRISKINAEMLLYSFRWSSLSIGVAGILEFLSIILIARMLQQGTISTGQLVTAIALQANIMTTLASFDSLKKSSRSSRLSYERLEDLFADLPEHRRNRVLSRTVPLEQLEKISYHEVTFGYRGESGPRALNRVSLEIQKGQVTLIRGMSGSGKSSLLGVISGSYLPQSGHLIVNELYRLDWSDAARQKCSTYVDQEYRFFEGSIVENLTLGRHYRLSEVEEMIDAAGLRPAILALPKGLNSEISDAARGLSGGQLQRLSIIRALLSGKPLVILDEPTSALDSESEELICKLILRYKSERIFVIASHSETFARLADHTVILSEGRVS